MDPVASVSASAAQGALAIEAGQANVTAGGTAQAQAQKLGLPPVGLAAAAAVNTLNAQLVSSQWGVDPASVSGVYGGAAESGGLFSGDSMLTLLQSLTVANAEQALAVLGIQVPSLSSREDVTPAAKPSASAAAVDAAAAATAQSSGGADVGTTVDPLWGVRA
jgi:hypothetical protein